MLDTFPETPTLKNGMDHTWVLVASVTAHPAAAAEQYDENDENE